MATKTTENAQSVTPTPAEMRLAQEAARRFAKWRGAKRGTVRISLERSGKNGAEGVAIPSAAFRLLIAALGELGKGNAVSVVPLRSELTTQQAADLLNVSRPYVIGLLEEGKIPFRLVGQHRRIRLDDVMSYKRKDDEARRRVLDELAAEAQDLDMGY